MNPTVSPSSCVILADQGFSGETNLPHLLGGTQALYSLMQIDIL